MELFYIERGCNSRTEIWERETMCKLHAYSCIWCKDKFVLSPPCPSPPPLTHPFYKCDKGSRPASISSPTPHTPWGLWPVFGDFGQSRGRPPFRSPTVLQLNLDSNCDYVRIFGAVIGHLEAEIDFWLFHRKWWKFRRAQKIWQSAAILTSRAGTVRERRRP